MVKFLSLLLSANKAERHPLEICIVAFFYASLSIVLSLWVFPEDASLVMVFFTVIACLYVVQNALIIDEEREKKFRSELGILKGHAKTLRLFLMLFLGFLFAFVFWSIALPDYLSDLAFHMQDEAVKGIRASAVQGKAISEGEAFGKIFSNNFRVLIISLLMALFYGAGSVFILAWNASIMGFVIGSIAKNSLGLATLPVIFTRYFLHGIPEMLAYFGAALAGGILFVALARGDIRRDRIKRLIWDGVIVIGISIFILLAAALLEVYVSPFI